MTSPKTVRDPIRDNLLTPQNSALVIIRAAARLAQGDDQARFRRHRLFPDPSPSSSGRRSLWPRRVSGETAGNCPNRGHL